MSKRSDRADLTFDPAKTTLVQMKFSKEQLNSLLKGAKSIKQMQAIVLVGQHNEIKTGALDGPRDYGPILIYERQAPSSVSDVTSSDNREYAQPGLGGMGGMS